ncbi:MAG TPA: tetratricopeptide repeat protein [Phycisphaerae bacterium]|nr:tetratricopeptide repeat protein [Phycisphaerae bacterium]
MTHLPIEDVLDAAIKHHQAGRFAAAESIYHEILAQHPEHADTLHLLGVLATQAGQNKLAVHYIGRAITINPKSPIFYNNLGSALLMMGSHDLAAASFRSALQLKPDYAQAHTNLGNVLKDQNQLEQAVECYRAALRFKPDLFEAYNNLGNALQALGRSEEAAAAYRDAITLKPDYAEAFNNLGVALTGLGRLDAGIAAYHAALEIKKDYPEAYNNLGSALKDQGRIDEAIDAYRTCSQIRPDLAQVHSNYVYNLLFHPDYDDQKTHIELEEWNRRHAVPLKNFIQPFANRPDPERRLRIGYVSPDFRRHVIGWNLLPLLQQHDRKMFEIFCYSNVAKPDEFTQRFHGLSDGWRDITTIDDQRAAQMIRQDGIDILVDLAMHMAGNRLLVFARKPAPIQVTFMGYPGTTGLETMDYRLTDQYLDPPEPQEAFYTEQSIRLPDTFWCYSSQNEESKPNDLPAIKNGFVTFGCLNNFCKVNDGVLKLWARVLSAIPHSRLMVLAPKGQVRRQSLSKLGRDGIASERIEFMDFQPRLEYLNTYHRIDIGLDTQPYNGHTTSLDSLWMGVPVVTLIGKTEVGRAGWSQLCNVGLQELAARTPEEYVNIAAKLAGDLPRLKELRAALRPRMQTSPLMDAKRFARNVEAAYRDMWRKWCTDAANRVENG